MASANTSGCINRITKEIAHIKKGTDLSLAVACKDHDVRQLRALIIGPPDSPYEFGFFEFQVNFPKDYPIKSPSVVCISTNNGRTRFNPNIYAGGKVCLSILGTWTGEKGEEWSSAQGLESVLLSIQSLMSPNPWENEPGEENGKLTDPKPAAYAAKIRHETLRIAVIERLEKIIRTEALERHIPLSGAKWSSASMPLPVSAPVAAESAVSVVPADPAVPVVSHKPEPLPPATAPSNSTMASKLMKSLEEFSNKDKPKPSENTDSDDLDDSDESPASATSAHSAHEYDAEATYHSFDTSSWDPFTDLMKRRFLWYYDSYVATIQKASLEQKDGTKFKETRFEGSGNSMSGAYLYAHLLTRLNRIRDQLSEECKIWIRLGTQQVFDKTGLATQLAFQFNQLEHHYNKSSYSGSRLELSLPDKNNPFRWNLTFFGQSSTNLDGGVFNLSLTIPPDFPSSWPRVYMETPIFHHRVSTSTNAVCYFPARPDEIGSHLRAIVAAIEDLEPKYDPRAIINPEAAKLLWGNEIDKKIYFRKLRRSAQDSMDFCGT